MFFKKKHTDSRPDLEEIRQVMTEEPVETRVQYRERESAPLFVKVEKYRNIIETVQDMKSFVFGLKQLFVVMREIEDIRNEALTIMQASVQRLEKNISDIDNEMLMPKSLDMEFKRDEIELTRIESSLLDLQKQLSSLKTELKEFK